MNSSSLLDWLMRTSLEASVLIAGVWLLRRALGSRLTPGWRIALWAVVGAKLLFPLSLSSLPGLASLWPKQEAPAHVITVSTAGAQPLQTEKVTLYTAPSGTGFTLTVSQWLTGVWLLGGVVVFSVALARDARFRRQLSRLPKCDDTAVASRVREIAQSLELRQALQIRLTPPLSIPAVTGLFRPTLLLPADWRTALSEDALDEVLKHELSHVKHHDLWWNWAALLVAALHWFNPLVWRAVTEFHEDRELRCDASPLAACSTRQRVAYGRALLRYQETLTAPVAMAGVAPFVRNQHSLHQRLLMITQPLVMRPWLHVVAAVSLGLFVCAAFGAERPEDDKKTTRTREGERSGGTRESGKRDGGEREGGGDMGREKREGGKPAEGSREGRKPAEGAKDGQRSREGMRDGDRGREGAKRDGEGSKEGGMRDGERSRTGPRDGERTREGGERGGKTSEGTGSLVLRVVDGGESVMVGKDKVPMNKLRAHLSKVLPEQPGVQVNIEADDDIPFKTVGQVLDAARDNGAKRAQIQNSTSSKGEG